ncbi:hypothetical protein QC762_602405 [Podospora pseudocomata]|uniref:NWD NACHT-NTPase N-terminal domain-containing protein n=1 Tax=Podospora pseudocomata TaxID=2093779 RepID=A0ABR0G765_9PEZI|nr:hypothetical protein QC762_602405 [Podospora pseudocomata]
MEREAVAKKPSRMKSVRQWLSLRVTQERTKTEAPAELLPNHEPSSQLEVDEGAARATPPETASNKNAAASTETGKKDCKDSKDDGDERGSTTVAQLDNTGAKGESESESEKKRPEDDKDDDDAVDKSARDFWKEAWESDELGEAKRALLQGRSGVGKSKDQKPSRANSIELVGLVIENTEAKMVNYKARWGSDNGETSLRNAKSILFSALTFKDLLNNVVNLIRQAIVQRHGLSSCLQLALHDKELADSTFKACSYLSHSMALYSRTESNYRERKAKQEKQLEDALVRVYTAILVYAAEVQESSNGRTRTRVKKFILSLAGQPLRDLETKINEEKSALEDWQNQVSRELADEAREEIMEIRTNTEVILKRVDGLAKTASDTYAKATAAELERLCEWLLKRDGGRQDKIRTSLATERAWWLNSGNSHWRPGGDGDKKGKKIPHGQRHRDRRKW